MKIILCCVGTLKQAHLIEGTRLFEKRLTHYNSFEIRVITPAKARLNDPLKSVADEGREIMEQLKAIDFVVLLDENGKEFSSVGFATLINSRMNSGIRSLGFVIGGAYGVSEEVRKESDLVMGLSSMTFTHEMARFFFTEQLYRAFTILRSEKYHH